ncbi:hypothetical protein KL86SPO_20107 [uncultured Sporomusa sp.]|uniref:Uncharacterized protein n=1 Tax=uncultured Sporomusa sp. TaxID=307249 RepID=A0A212LLY8_9FIRM|nr:hypothetical protein KL86SPO_20107 [uncultured Sporomusa sp.]
MQEIDRFRVIGSKGRFVGACVD